MVNFAALSLTLNLMIFAAAACAVWLAGSKIAAYADELAERFGLSHALLGLFMLAGVTSLPEIATSFTAARSDNAALAVNNLLGSIAMQVAVLAIADMVFSKRALTSIVPNPVVMLQGALNVCLLGFVTLAVIVGEIAFFGAGAWSWGLFAASVFSFYKISEADQRHPWVVNDPEDRVAEREDQRKESDSVRSGETGSVLQLVAKTGFCALVILLAGYIVATAGDVIAQQSGLGASFVGVAFVAIATSLPEASTVFTCMRRGLYTMAISDILGTNIFNVMLLFGVDVLAPGAPVLGRAGNFSAVGALLGLIVTSLFLAGLVERGNRTVWRMGQDSAAVLAVYGGGMVLLYFMRGS